MADRKIIIIGGGLAGTEAAWQAARRGVSSVLYEMRPRLPTPAHQTDRMAELVCSNSLKSDRENSAPWLLKEEMRRAGSLLLRIARECAVPAGQALAVDRERFAEKVTVAIEAESRIEVRREEVREIPDGGIVLIATGPLTSDALAASIQHVTGIGRLFFYDAISPIVDASTVDRSKVFAASRYGRNSPKAESENGNSIPPGCEGEGDYLNCSLDEEEYQRFYDALLRAESVALHDFEDRNFFEACLPLEELARRGRDTLRFGPMKPVGLRDPRTGRMPYAAVQLRQENLRADSFNLVGFQNHLKFGEQKRILRMIPGLEQAEFLRYGQIHRNTYINAPSLLTPTLQLRSDSRILFAGQICGVEGYVESIATGMMAGMHAARLALTGGEPVAPPRATGLGSLCHYITHADPKNYQPANMSFDLLPPLCATMSTTGATKLGRPERHARQCSIALAKLNQWLGSGSV
ncbi:MAG: methylenetetrahydrofolate--tRNA-(uracil(54)-C(5))-methyltransferase (FADH(2)-oxidizing) TrmFO [Acidobacteria bacterium]|nr:methylenetetrahydrofolate--tRNA-(uracil(54)-C(5))-methyltransferase (FADH(2)-oxidizing) TrmFO [Acidobacteriota bacterium]